jgi:hypothetical protein
MLIEGKIFNGRVISNTFNCRLCGNHTCHSCRMNRVTDGMNVFCCRKCFNDPRKVIVRKFPFAVKFEGQEKIQDTGVNFLAANFLESSIKFVKDSFDVSDSDSPSSWFKW